MLLILGWVLIILGILIALPILGLGLILPGIGDMIDLPISAVMVLVGLVFLFLGGLEYILYQYWWAILIGLIIWYVLFVIKIGRKK